VGRLLQSSGAAVITVGCGVRKNFPAEIEALDSVGSEARTGYNSSSGAKHAVIWGKNVRREQAIDQNQLGDGEKIGGN